MSDWTKPAVDSHYDDVWDEVISLVTSAAKMDYSGDTNVPSGLMGYNRSTKRLQDSGVDVEITNLADGAVSSFSKLADGVILVNHINTLTGFVLFDVGYGPRIKGATFSAAGSASFSATPLTYGIALITSATSAINGVRLPAPVQWQSQRIINLSGFSIQVWPDTGHSIGFGNDVPISIPPGQDITFYAHTTSLWYSSGIPPTLYAPQEAGITGAGSAQFSATGLSSGCRLHIVQGAAGSGLRLPVPSAIGETHTIINYETSNQLLIWPSTGFNIRGLATNANTTLNALKGKTYVYWAGVEWLAVTDV